MAYHQTTSSRRQVSAPGSSTNGRRVAPASSLSSRFQQVHQSRRANASSTPAPTRSAVPSHARPSVVGKGARRGRAAPPRRAFQTASRQMDIDSGDISRGRRGGSSPLRNSRRDQVGRGRGRGGARGDARSGRSDAGSSRRGGRGGRGTGRGGRTVPLNRDKLDMDLDNYMMGDSKTGRTILDQDLDSYMMSNPSTNV